MTEAGHITDEKRQEFILLSDVFGVSMQTINVSNQTNGNATEATEIPIGGDISGGACGEPSWIFGTVKDTDGNPPMFPPQMVGNSTSDGPKLSSTSFWLLPISPNRTE